MVLLADIAARAEGRVVGDDQISIEGVGSLANAGPGDLAQYSNLRFKAQLRDTKAAAVLLTEDAVQDCPVASVVVPHPQLTFAQVAATFDKRVLTPVGIHPTAQIDPTASIGDNVRVGSFVDIGPHAVIEDGVELCSKVSIGAYSKVGQDSSIRANATLYHDVRLGARCTVHSNSIIGADGFGITPDATGKLQEIPQVGGVVIGDDVLVGASSTIDRGTLDDTVLEDNVKLDDHVHIAHNCHIGAHSILCGCVGLAGSVTLGQYCLLAGGVGVAGEGALSIAAGTQVGSMTFVSRDITEPGRYSGATLHTDNPTWRRNMLRLNELNEIAKRLRRVEDQLEDELSARKNSDTGN